MADLTDKQLDLLFDAVDLDHDALVGISTRLALEVQRHRKMVARLEAWAATLDDLKHGWPGPSSRGVGPHVAEELRNRMKG